MIYYCHHHQLAMQRIQDCVTRSKCTLVAELDNLDFKTESEVFLFIEKWDERYDLRMTSKQRYDAKKKGYPTFDLVVHIPTHRAHNFIDDLVELAKNTDRNSFKKISDIVEFSNEKLEVKFYLFCNIDSEKVKSHSIAIDELNKILREQVSGAERFRYIDRIDFEGYELIRLTQKQSLVDRIEGIEKNTTDWTWRLSKEKYAVLQRTGQQLINRFHQVISADAQTQANYFEKHFNSLEALQGFRAVRKQIYKIYSSEKKSMKKKYGIKGENSYRSLHLRYTQRLSNRIAANSTPYDFFEELRIMILDYADKDKIKN